MADAVVSEAWGKEAYLDVKKRAFVPPHNTDGQPPGCDSRRLLGCESDGEPGVETAEFSVTCVGDAACGGRPRAYAATFG